MPVTKIDGGIVQRWVKDGQELSKVFMNSSPWHGGPDGLVFINRPQVVNKLYLKIRGWRHPTRADKSYLNINLQTGYFVGNTENYDFQAGGILWVGNFTGDLYPMTLNDVPLIERIEIDKEWVNGAHGSGWVYTRKHYVQKSIPGLIVERLNEYTSATVTFNRVNGDTTTFWITQVPSPANGWVLGMRGDEGPGNHDWASDIDIILTLT